MFFKHDDEAVAAAVKMSSAASVHNGRLVVVQSDTQEIDIPCRKFIGFFFARLSVSSLIKVIYPAGAPVVSVLLFLYMDP